MKNNNAWSSMRQVVNAFRVFSTTFVVASMIAALPASAGLLTVEFSSVITMNGDPVEASGQFVLDDTIAWPNQSLSNVIVSGQLDLGGELFSVVTDSSFTGGISSGTQGAIALLGDYGEQLFGIELFFNQSLFDFDSQFDALLNLTIEDLLPSSTFYFFESDPFVNFTGAITAFSSFEGTAAIPEPPVIALAGLGFVLIWSARRRAV